MRIISAMATATVAFMALNAATPDNISVTTPQGRTVTVQALSNTVIKVSNTAPGESVEASKVTVMQPGGFSGTTTENRSKLTLATPTGVVASLDKNSGELSLTARCGATLHDSSLRATDSQGRNTMRLTTGSTAFHGAGERGHRFNLAGDTLAMYNRQNYGYTEGDSRISQMNISMPLLVSPKGYAIVFDDYAESELIAADTLTYSTISPWSTSYYFISSPEGFEGVPAELSALTGRQPIAPLWSLGYITSKYGYKTQAETDSVVDMLKSKGYPLDGIVLDLYWYGKEADMGRLEWDSEQWPDHIRMLKGLKDKGVNLVAISQPYIIRDGHGITNYNNLSAKGMLGRDSIGGVKGVKTWVGEGGMLDVSNPDTRAWLRERYRRLTDEGITGWWGDLGEPEVHPDGMRHANGLTTRQYHNLYGNDWSSIIHDLFREEYPGQRLMTLMRGGTTGLQRYSVFPWSTDVSRSWGGLQPQVKIMLNAGLSGLGYMSHDIGGFAVDKANPIDPELYVRWLQLGLFSPVMRTHSTVAAEPYVYENLQDILLPLVKKRYEWLPYNYTLAWENASAGLPLVRPIGMHDNNPENYSDVEDQYLWGRDVMVAPVMKQGATSRQVRFPSGTWVDYNHPATVYSGENTFDVEAPLDRLPLFVRGGALIPKAKYPMENTGDFRPDNYTAEYFPTPGCGKTSFTLFEDDRRSPGSIEVGEYALLTLTADNSTDSITLEATVAGSYPDMPARRTVTFEIANVDAPDTVVSSASAKISSSYTGATRTLTITATWRADSPLSITITK